MLRSPSLRPKKKKAHKADEGRQRPKIENGTDHYSSDDYQEASKACFKLMVPPQGTISLVHTVFFNLERYC